MYLRPQTKSLTSDLKIIFISKLMRSWAVFSQVHRFFSFHPCTCPRVPVRKTPLICSLLLTSPWHLSSEASGRQLAERTGLGSIKARPRLICHPLHCKYTWYVHMAQRSPWVLRPVVLSALAARHILRLFKAENPWTIMKCPFSASSAFIQPLSSRNGDTNAQDVQMLFKDTSKCNAFLIQATIERSNLCYSTNMV